MAIRTGYFGFEVSDLDAWQRYADLIGLGIERDGSGLFLRMDEKARRIHCIEGSADDIAWLGWEVDDVDEFAQRRAHLEAMGIATMTGDPASADLRGVEQFFHFSDPNGVRHEIAHGMIGGDAFASGRIAGGFVTGDLGIGHVAFNSTDHLEDERFLRETLSARLSDYIYQPLGDGSMMHASFLHLNPRHHSVAYAQGLGTLSRLHHFQIEMNTIVDVGTTYERLQAAGVGIAMTLGQHSNDRIMSFYAQTPSHFLMELGYGGITIDDEAAWAPVIHDRISEWGHKMQMA